jgi:hypothetical protein
MSDIKEIIVQLQVMIQENCYNPDDRAFVKEIGDMVNSLVDQVNELSDVQDQLRFSIARG